MKQKLALLVAAALALPTIVGAVSPFEYAEPQAKIMVENRKMWEIPPGEPHGTVGYAVTDLDHNGRLELIVSTFGGTAMYTYSRIFEVNYNMDGLVEVQLPWGLEDSQPDILGVSAWGGFRAPDSEVYVYGVSDMIKEDYFTYVTNQSALSLQGGHLIERKLATKTTTYTPEREETVVYTNVEGEAISEEDYTNAFANAYTGWNPAPATLDWLVYHGDGWADWDSLTEDGRQSLLQASYSAFMGEPAVG